MERDSARIRLVTAALGESGFDALVCASPEDVLMVSGYWPVIGNAVAVLSADGVCAVIAPQDEMRFVRGGWAGYVLPFQAGSLDRLPDPEQAVAEPLADALAQLRLSNKSVVALAEDGPSASPSGYAARFTYGSAVRRLIAGHVDVQDGTRLLQRLRSVLTSREVDNVRAACTTAAAAFSDVAQSVVPGATENGLAARLRSGLSRSDGNTRADGFAYCMSGANAAQAWAAFQHSTDRRIEAGDLVLIHCNSFHNGYWTDITRTYCAGKPRTEVRRMYDAVFEARDAAVAAVRPGVQACAVDEAARSVLAKHGFGKAFRHPTGHGVGFAAANHNAEPRIHPCARELLQPGMVFNIEPAIYINGFGGLRHCDMVVVNDFGCEVLTQFQVRIFN